MITAAKALEKFENLCLFGELLIPKIQESQRNQDNKSPREIFKHRRKNQ